MDWRERVVEGFPPPYRGEPASLRRDIEDELADHLALATEREMDRAGDEAAARKAAIKQFGNPRALARQLWFEAMKERIMKDRIMTVAMSLLAIAAIIGGVFAFKAFEQSRETSQAMIAALEKLATMNQEKGMETSNMVTATFRIVDESNKPLKGVKIELSGHMYGETVENLFVLTNDKGISQFGPVMLGQYGTTITTRDMASRKQVNLYQGQNYEETIVVPNLTMVPVKPTVDLPEDLKESPLWFSVRIKGSYINDGQREWEINEKSIWVNSKYGVYDRVDNDSDYIKLGEKYNNNVVMVPACILTLDSRYMAYAVGDSPDNKRNSILKIKGGLRVTSKEESVDVQKGDEYRINIDFDEHQLKIISQETVSIRDLNGELSGNLCDKIKGRLVGLQPLAKDCTIYMNRPDEHDPAIEYLNFSDSEGWGGRMLVDWLDINIGDLLNEHCKYYLALYADNVNDKGYLAAQSENSEMIPKIMAYRIEENWTESTTWNTMPRCEKKPTAEYAFVSGTSGWRLFDVTPFMKDSKNKPFYGVMFEFNNEHPSETSSSVTGYHFYSRDADSRTPHFDDLNRPLLLIVEQDERDMN